MNIFGLGWIFNRFRRHEHAEPAEMEGLISPKLQAYLDFLRDHGAGATYGSSMIGYDERPMELPLAA